MDGNRDTQKHILNTQSTKYISYHCCSYQRMWPCRHNMKSHEHSGVDCASMVGHTDQDWIAVETWGQGYQLRCASQYPRSLTPFRTLIACMKVLTGKVWETISIEAKTNLVSSSGHFRLPPVHCIFRVGNQEQLVASFARAPLSHQREPRTGGLRPPFVHINPKFPLGIRPSSIFPSTCHFLKYCHHYFGIKMRWCQSQGIR